jgi:hypothetical protein
MLWYKAWVDTRLRFFIGLALLMLSACGIVLYYPAVVRLMPMANSIDTGGEIGRRIREGVELASNYRGYVWSQWFRQNVTEMGTLFAVLLGSGSAVAQGSSLFTLSLPVTRNSLLAVRTATGLAEWFVIAMLSPLVIPLLSPAVGQSYGVGAALVHGVCMFVAGTVFFSLAVLLSTIFSDLWRPLLIACSAGVVLSFFEQIVGSLSRYGLFGLMSGEIYFRDGGLPWLGLLASTIASAAMLFAASRNFARQDF